MHISPGPSPFTFSIKTIYPYTFLKIMSTTLNNMIVLFMILFLLINNNSTDAKIGINWGRRSLTKLTPSTAVDLLLQNKVSEAKIYSSEDEVIEAFSGTQIGLAITINNMSQITSLQKAKEWVKKKIASFPYVDIKYIYVGNQPFAEARFKKTPFSNVVMQLKLIQDALNQCGYGGKVKATFSHPLSGSLKPNISKPSEAEFLDDFNEELTQTLKILKLNNAPFVFDIFPIAYMYFAKLDPNFAFFDNKSSHIVEDANGLVYHNLFDFVYDSFVHALNKLGSPDMKIIVGHIGWPTDGFPGANFETAERFYKGLLPLVASNRGTPLRPNAPIDIYIHSLTDEKMGSAFMPYVRHWGIYRSNGEPKYKIDLSGQGRDVFPTAAKGINRMPERWCVYNSDKSDMQKVMQQFTFACNNADCTSLAPGGSCSMLGFNENVSYAFNVYFQSKFQDEYACKFAGLSQVVVNNPSRNGCVFPVEVVRDVQNLQISSVKKFHETVVLIFGGFMFLVLCNFLLYILNGFFL